MSLIRRHVPYAGTPPPKWHASYRGNDGYGWLWTPEFSTVASSWSNNPLDSENINFVRAEAGQEVKMWGTVTPLKNFSIDNRVTPAALRDLWHGCESRTTVQIIVAGFEISNVTVEWRLTEGGAFYSRYIGLEAIFQSTGLWWFEAGQKVEYNVTTTCLGTHPDVANPQFIRSHILDSDVLGNPYLYPVPVLEMRDAIDESWSNFEDVFPVAAIDCGWSWQGGRAMPGGRAPDLIITCKV